MKNFMKKNSIRSMRNIEVLIKRKKTEYSNKKLKMLPVHEHLSKSGLNIIQKDYDATSLNPSTMCDKNSIYPKTEKGYSFKPWMNDIFFDDNNNKPFNKDGNDIAMLQTKFYNPPNLLFQQLAVKEKIKNDDVNRMRKSSIVDTSTLVAICENVERGGKVIQIYEGVIYRQNIKILPLRNFMENLLILGQKHETEKKFFKATIC